VNIQIYVGAVADPEKAVSYDTVFSTAQYHCLCYNNSNYNRSTGIKVYSSDINTNVYGSYKNRVNHPLKVTHESNLTLQIRIVSICYTSRC